MRQMKRRLDGKMSLLSEHLDVNELCLFVFQQRRAKRVELDMKC